jgi:hypothetical protein
VRTERRRQPVPEVGDARHRRNDSAFN